MTECEKVGIIITQQNARENGSLFFHFVPLSLLAAIMLKYKFISWLSFVGREISSYSTASHNNETHGKGTEERRLKSLQFPLSPTKNGTFFTFF